MSAAKKYYWLKLKTDFFNQREIKKLRKIAGGDTFTIIYLKMQLLSVKNEGVITFEQTENHLDEQLALELDEELENVRLTLLFLQNNALIEPISDFDYMMPKVVESIGSETDSAERVRQLRKREKQLALQCNDDVTTCNTEIDKELEKKKSINTKKFTPPSLQDVIDYCVERNNGVDAKRFYDSYSVADWIDSNGKQIINWKQKMIQIWEKKESKTSQKQSHKGIAPATNTITEKIEKWS